MTKLHRILYALALAVGISTVARAGEEPLQVNEGPRQAPGIVFSEPAAELPLSASLYRSTWGEADGEHVLIGRIFGPWTKPTITTAGQELVRSYVGMSRETVIFETTKSRAVFLGWVDPAIDPPDTSGLSAGIYSYCFVFNYAGAADTIEAGMLVVSKTELTFERGGQKLVEER